MREEIRPIPGWEGLYSVSRSGKIYSHRVMSNKQKRRGKKVFIIDENSFTELKPSYSKARGYYMVSFFRRNGKRKYPYVHRLLAMAFLPNPNGYKYVNHLDGVKTNNALDNLEWCTKRHDAKHARDMGLFKCYGEDNPMAKLKNTEREEIYNIYLKSKLSLSEIAERYKVHRCTIYNIIKKKKENLK